jgi:hypothetical protein
VELAVPWQWLEDGDGRDEVATDADFDKSIGVECLSFVYLARSMYIRV